MGLETRTLNNIDVKFTQADIQKPTIWWEYGTLWADTNDLNDVRLIKEGVEEVINNDFEVKISKRDATDSEPWD